MAKNIQTGYILLGSNLKNREKQLKLATFLINEKIGSVSKKSKIYETEPWGTEGQADFLNQILEIKTNRSPIEILETCLDIESKMGRKRLGKYSARVIDIDLLFLGDEIVESEKLTLPHPRLHLRRFVLKPMVEIAPELIHPVFGKTMKMLLDECPDELEVNIFGD